MARERTLRNEHITLGRHDQLHGLEGLILRQPSSAGHVRAPAAVVVGAKFDAWTLRERIEGDGFRTVPAPEGPRIAAPLRRRRSRGLGCRGGRSGSCRWRVRGRHRCLGGGQRVRRDHRRAGSDRGSDAMSVRAGRPHATTVARRKANSGRIGARVGGLIQLILLEQLSAFLASSDQRRAEMRFARRIERRPPNDRPGTRRLHRLVGPPASCICLLLVQCEPARRSAWPGRRAEVRDRGAPWNNASLRSMRVGLPAAARLSCISGGCPRASSRPGDPSGSARWRS
jgi:hypothetical protein